MRSIVRVGMYLTVFQGMFQYAFAMRWNLAIGIPDTVCVVLSEAALGMFITSLSVLPTMALFSQITPKNVEGTIFALLTGTCNLSYYVIAPFIGSQLNSLFIHPPVTADNLSTYSYLMAINFLFSFIGLSIIPLLPFKSEVKSL